MEELIQSSNANQAQASDASSNASNDEQAGCRVQIQQQQQERVRPRPEVQPRDVARVNDDASTSRTVPVAINHGNQPNQDAQQLAPPVPPRVEAN